MTLKPHATCQFDFQKRTNYVVSAGASFYSPVRVLLIEDHTVVEMNDKTNMYAPVKLSIYEKELAVHFDLDTLGTSFGFAKTTHSNRQQTCNQISSIRYNTTNPLERLGPRDLLPSF